MRRWRRSEEEGAPAVRLSFGDWDHYPGGRVVGVCHPDWRGVRTAAYTFGVPVVEAADVAAPASGLVEVMAEAGVEVLVVQGFPPGTPVLLAEAHRRGLATRCVHYSSTAQHGAGPSEWAIADDLVNLARRGILGGLGFAKEGMAEAFEALGHPAAFVPVRIPALPGVRPVKLERGQTHVGVFAEAFWRKNLVTQLTATALVENAVAHVLELPPIGYLDGLAVVEHGVVPYEAFLPLLAGVDINLYVTLSECLPLTPLESYLVGVPCLASRTSVLFRDDPELWDLSTVDELDNPRAVAAAAARLLAHREQAVLRAGLWMERWDGYAAGLWNDFVGDPA